MLCVKFLLRRLNVKFVKGPSAILCAFSLIGLLNGCAEEVRHEQPSRNIRMSFAATEPPMIADRSVQASNSAKRNSVIPLLDGEEALAVWLETLSSARRSIDIQTFIYSNDEVGKTISNVLSDAADRGVVVRLLIDDFFHYIQNSNLGHLDAHENIEVRVFNPLSRNLPPLINYLADYRNVDGRMHNKVIVVDGEKSIIGGRNVADEYFRLDRKHYFSDFDVLLQGGPVRSIQSSFEAFWSDRRSKSYSQVNRDRAKYLEPSDEIKVKRNIHHVGRFRMDTSRVARALPTEISAPKFVSGGTVRFDRPEKLDRSANGSRTVAADSMLHSISRAEKSVFIVTPYFAPQEKNASMLANLAARGVAVTVLTNSLGATNHASVHPGYMRHRKRLITSGVRIFEHREDVTVAFQSDEGNHRPRVMTHSKLTLIDGRYLIAGSLNFDPRSIHKNTETIILLDSPKLVAWLNSRLLTKLRDNSYKVSLSEDQTLTWSLLDQEEETISNSEPAGNLGNAIVSMLFSFVPPGFNL